MNKVQHPKPREFKEGTHQGRLVVTIARQADLSWEIKPSVPSQIAIIRHRIEVDLTKAGSHKNNESIDEEWTRRKTADAPDEPHFRRDPHHVPILLREGEDVEFVCDPPFKFAVYMGRDGEVNLEDDPRYGQGPDNPFGWTGRREAVANTTIRATVEGPFANNGPADQRFFKVKAWVWEQGPDQEPTVLDPDGICDR